VLQRKLLTNASWCKGCGICVSFCPKQVLGLEQGRIVILKENDCIYCKMCELRCPDFAIYIEEREVETNA